MSGSPRRTSKTPPELRRLRESLSTVRRVELFRTKFARDPVDEDELERFITELTLTLYNEGFDHV